MTNTHCSEFKKSSEFIHKWLGKQTATGEESITDWLLFTLSDFPQSKLKYIKFTRKQEGCTTGADWEWWVIGNKFSIGMRIQAKKIIEGEDKGNYKRLAYENKHGRQIEKLIQDAKANNFIPFYALYCAPTKTQKVICPKSAKKQGVFIASAQVLFDSYIKNGKTKVEADDILSKSKPLHCMACCLIHGGKPSVLSFYEYIKFYYNKDSDTEELGKYETNNIPPYVTRFLEGGHFKTQEYKESFKDELKEFNSLVVLDLRDE